MKDHPSCSITECESYAVVGVTFTQTFSWADLVRLAFGGKAKFVVELGTWNAPGSIEYDGEIDITMTVEEKA